MFDAQDILIGICLAYYWTAFEMVYFHAQQLVSDQPGYVRSGSLWQRLLAGALWPYVTKSNQEFAWFFVCFISSAIVMTVAHMLLYPLVQSSAMAAVIVALLRVSPFTSGLVAMPLTFLAMIFWMLFARPFGAKFPS